MTPDLGDERVLVHPAGLEPAVAQKHSFHRLHGARLGMSL
jgi:hypothetical protein